MAGPRFLNNIVVQLLISSIHCFLHDFYGIQGVYQKFVSDEKSVGLPPNGLMSSNAILFKPQ